MRGGEEATTEAYPGYAAGRSDRANEAEGSSSPTPSANSTVELGRNRSGSGDEEGPRCEAARKRRPRRTPGTPQGGATEPTNQNSPHLPPRPPIPPWSWVVTGQGRVTRRGPDPTPRGSD